MSAPVVQLRDLQVHAGERLLLAVPSLRIEAGERVALMGHNGAGKSTLMRLLGGFAPAGSGSQRLRVSGEVEVLGRPLNPALRGRALRELRHEMGQVLQGLHLVPRLTARENVLLGALPRLPGWRSWARLYPPALLAEADAALNAVGLLALAHQRADRLSGGEKQKLGIARLRLQTARLVLADEPTAHLDPNAALAACGWLREAAAGATLITVVHHSALLPQLADRVLGLRAGRLVLDSRLDQPSPQAFTQALAALYQAAGPDAAPALAPLDRSADALRPLPTAPRPGSHLT